MATDLIGAPGSSMPIISFDFTQFPFPQHSCFHLDLPCIKNRLAFDVHNIANPLCTDRACRMKKSSCYLLLLTLVTICSADEHTSP